MQTKQQHRRATAFRFLDEERKVIGWEGKYPADTTEDDWEDIGPFDPILQLEQLAKNKQKRQLDRNAKLSVAAANLYTKLISRGYTPEEASASTGYIPQ